MDECDHRFVDKCQAIGNGIRLEIIEMLMERPHYVSEIAEKEGKSVSTTSEHLKELRINNFVQFDTKGDAKTYYEPKRRDLIEAFLEIRDLLRREDGDENNHSEPAD